MIPTTQDLPETSSLTLKEGVRSRYRNEAARSLLREWRNDTSGYDEKSWPKVKQIIEQNRLSIRSKFGD